MPSRSRHAAAMALVIALGAGCTGGDGAASTTVAPEPTTTMAPTSTTTEPPLVGQALVVAEQGLSTFPDPIDATASLGGYGVVLQNPDPDLVATGVRVVTRILDAAGTELLVDSAVLNAVMPGQRMAVGRTLIEPITGPTQLDVRVEVGAWLRPAATTGSLTATDVATVPEEGGGSATTFTLTSTRPEVEDAVDVTAIYRAADGRILGAESTTIASISPGASLPGRIPLLTPIPDLAATELFVGRGVAAQTTG